MNNKTVEDAAVRFVIEHESAAQRAARDVRSTGAAGDVESAGRMIEIKAYGKSARGTFLWLESRQYEEAKANPDFWVYVVDNINQGDPERFGLIKLGGAELATLIDRAKEQRTYVLPFPVAMYDRASERA
jgi:hypothetical protein